ncbi:hypothetical protein KUF54_05805 [Comamonas sp. Y33R10-2]|uniref:hypothetical protein n=1 Tax=Comamonas sp. Y33R10-2 TaxID=2853257 RepID=UPI001C5C8E7F|nr:hypothetical protein [Comamonas sp. Y33R10-2]QXZ10721.1 hypothetical protein KUF54_05805 [Comamonas sp. Y33R10-2]
MDISLWQVPKIFEHAVHSLEQPLDLRCDVNRRIGIHARQGTQTAPNFQIILQPELQTAACKHRSKNPRSASPLCLNDCLGALKRPLELRGVKHFFCVNLDRASANDANGFVGVVDQLRDLPVTLRWG